MTTQSKLDNTDEMSDAEIWQRIALEATVNDDLAKALAMRIEAAFEDAAALPRLNDTLAVYGVDSRDLDEFLLVLENMTGEFTFDETPRTIENSENGEEYVHIEDIQYTGFVREF